MRSSFALALSISAAVAALPAAAIGQVNFTPGPIAGGTSVSGGGIYSYSTFDSFGGALGGLLGTTGRTDWNWQLPRSNFNGSVSQGQYATFTVGPLPVQIGELRYRINGKWVNGGGNTNNPLTTVNWNVAINEYISGFGNVTVASLSPTGAFIQNGNGYMVLDESASKSSGFVLAAGRQYTLAFEMLTTVQVDNWNNSTPNITVTNEFGGGWAPGFNGAYAAFTWETVPTPGAGTLMALTGLAALRRKR